MRVTNVTRVGTKKVYDISVKDAEHYVLENGVVTHNTGVYYSANQIFIIGRSQEKEGTDVIGYKFTINIEKSRFVKEKSKLPFQVMFDAGIDKFGGLLDLAIEAGFVVKPSNGYYQKTKSVDEKKYREKETHCKEFWAEILADRVFYDFVKNKYQLAAAPINVSDDEDE